MIQSKNTSGWYFIHLFHEKMFPEFSSFLKEIENTIEKDIWAINATTTWRHYNATQDKMWGNFQFPLQKLREATAALENETCRRINQRSCVLFLDNGIGLQDGQGEVGGPERNAYETRGPLRPGWTTQLRAQSYSTTIQESDAAKGQNSEDGHGET